MNNNINNNVESQAEQCDWLDVSYTARQYSQPQPEKSKSATRFKFPKKLKLNWKAMSLTVLTVFVLLSAIFVGFSGVLDGVTDIYLASVFSSSSSGSNYQTIDLPYNVDITSVDGGVITFGGGSIVVSFTAGTVSQVGDGTVSVDVDESTTLVYGNIDECYVVVGSSVSYCDVLAKYTDSATVSIVYQDTVVTNLVGSDYILQWGV